MAAYGSQDSARAGLCYGVGDLEVETKVAASGVTFEFGEAVFVDSGVEDVAYAPDSTDTSLKFLGIAIISQSSCVDSEGNYPPFSSIDVLTEGEVYVQVASGLTTIANQPAYVLDVTTDGQYQKFTTDSTAADVYDIGCFFRSNASNGLARIEVRGLK